MKLKAATNIVTKEFFQATLVTYLLLTLAETLKEGFVSNFFNMNYLLVAVLVSGVAMVLSETPERVKNVSKRVSSSVIRLAVISARRAREARIAAQRHIPINTEKRPLGQRPPKTVDGFISPRTASSNKKHT